VRWWLIVLLLLVPVSVSAQTHPCDTAPTPNPIVKNTYRVQFCWDAKDLDGNPILPADVQMRLAIDGTAQALRALPTPISAPNATGSALYEYAGLASLKGAHSITVTAVTAEGEATSVPFAYAVKGGPPKPPLVPRVAQ